jgi:hypothetical protein
MYKFVKNGVSHQKKAAGSKEPAAVDGLKKSYKNLPA